MDGHEVAVKVFREPVAMADVAPLLADPDRPSAVWPRGRVPRGTLGVLQLGARVDEVGNGAWRAAVAGAWGARVAVADLPR